MGKPLKWTPEQKLPLVLSVLRGEGSVAEVARRHRVSDVTLAKWRDAFLAGGRAALANGSRGSQSGREAELEAELEEIKAALGEAHAELRVWRKKGAIYPPSRTSS
jgi:transposase